MIKMVDNTSPPPRTKKQQQKINKKIGFAQTIYINNGDKPGAGISETKSRELLRNGI